MHLTWAENRRSVREEHHCEPHAKELLIAYHETPHTGNSEPAFLDNARCFDVEVVVISDTCDQQVVFLREAGGPICIPIVIGWVEASNIVRRLQGVEPPRPPTDQAMLSAISALGGEVTDVLVDKLEGHVYYAKVRVQQGARLVILDMRPSDAISVALAAKRPIFFTEELVRRITAENC